MSKWKRKSRNKGGKDAAGRGGHRAGGRYVPAGGSGRGDNAGRGDDAAGMVWRVRNWRRVYEPDPQGAYKDASKFPPKYIRFWINDDKHGNVLRAEIEGQRRAMRAVGGRELCSFAIDLLVMAADKPLAGLRGCLTNFRGEAATVADIALVTGDPVAMVGRWLHELSGPQVAFLERVELSEARREVATLLADKSAGKKSQTTGYEVASDGGATGPIDGLDHREQDAAAGDCRPGKPPSAGGPGGGSASNREKSSTFFGESSEKSATVAVEASKEKNKEVRDQGKSACTTACGKTALSGRRENGIARGGSIGTGREKEQEQDASGEGPEPQSPVAVSPAVAAGAVAPGPSRTDAAGGAGEPMGATNHQPSPCRPTMARNEAVWAKLRERLPMATWGEFWADKAAWKLTTALVCALGVRFANARDENRHHGAMRNAWIKAMELTDWTEAEACELFEKAIQKAWALNAQALAAAKGERKAIDPARVWMSWWRKSTAKAADERDYSHV